MKKADLKTIFVMIKQLKYIMTKKQKQKSILLFMVILLGALFETLGVSAIVPFIQSLLMPEQLMENKYIKPIVNALNITNSSMLIYLLALFIVIIYLVKNVFLAYSTYMQADFRYRFQKEVSTEMLESYLKRPYTYFVNVNSSEILRGISGDVIGVFVIFEFSFKLLSELITTVLLGVFLIYTDLFMAIGVLIIAGICFSFVTAGFRFLMRGAGERQRNAQAQTNKYAYQAINGIKDIIVMKRSKFFIRNYNESYEDMRETDTLVSFLGGCPERIIEAFCISGMIGIICVRIKTGVNVSQFVPQLAAFAMSAFRILPSVSRMIGYISGLIYQRTALEASYNNLKEVHEYEENRIINIEENKEVDISAKGELIDKIEIKDIYWKYEGTEKEVLKGLSLEVRKGESVALIGESGAGKSTLADIILGLYEPQRGSVLKDSRDIFKIPGEWSRTIGYVPQSVFLTDDTIRNNVAFGIDKKNINDEMIWKALEKAQLLEFVKKLPESLDTVVGEHGVRFSGGQRQRIAIARAIYYDPDVLVLDEATSALDKETEETVMEAIETLQGNKTLIIVAHRLSTIRKCDRIYEIKNGKAFMRRPEEVLERS